MILNRLFNFIYRRSPEELVRWCILAVLCFVLLQRRWGRQRWWKGLLVSGLIVWAGAVLYATLFSRIPRAGYSMSVVPFHSYLEVLGGGSRDLLRSNFMNGYLFFPAGVLCKLLLPERTVPWRKLAVIAAVFFCVSLSVEIMQYHYSVGHFEADDILHNTLGAVGGYALCGWALGNVPPGN